MTSTADFNQLNAQYLQICQQFNNLLTQNQNQNNVKTEDPKPKPKKPRSINPFYQLNSLPASSKTRDEINILVIGETGVGKSTWINGIANYMTFNNFKDAMNSENPICLIPMNFNLYNGESLEKVNVNIRSNVGHNNKNEANSDTGESCTQKPKVYRFKTKSKIFNFIDTPGIGDTRGIERDQENVKMIMKCLSNWEVIHMICFLLKPNESRLRISLKYCIEELLVNFHKNSIPNFAFIFTNSCNTLYRPGDTMTVLKELFKVVEAANQSNVKLTNDNIYCIDNEAIRMLFAHHQSVKFEKKHIKTFEKSWKHTLKETFRLFQYAADSTPHLANETKAIWQVRSILIELSKILIEMNEEIDQHQKINNEKTKELYLLKMDLTKKEANCVEQEIRVKKTPLARPNVVCNSHTCIETFRNPETDLPETLFKQVCCKACIITNVIPQMSPATNLRNCFIFDNNNNGNCRTCSCSWQCHMQIWFTQEKSIGQYVDKKKLYQIELLKQQIAFKQSGISSYDIKVLQSKHKFIIKLCEPYFLFLKQNSIIFINTAFEEYIMVSIEETEKSIKPGENRNSIHNLKKLLVAHQQLKSLNAAPSNTNQKITMENYEIKISKLKHHPFISLQLQNSENYQNIFEEMEHEVIKYAPKMSSISSNDSCNEPSSSKTSTSKKSSSKEPSTSIAINGKLEGQIKNSPIALSTEDKNQRKSKKIQQKTEVKSCTQTNIPPYQNNGQIKNSPIALSTEDKNQRKSKKIQQKTEVKSCTQTNIPPYQNNDVNMTNGTSIKPIMGDLSSMKAGKQKTRDISQIPLQKQNAPIPPHNNGINSIRKLASKSDSFQSSGTNLYVSNLESWVNNKKLGKMFEEFGEIISVKVIYNSGKADNRYGFVNFKNYQNANAAINLMNGKLVNSKRLHVSLASNYQ